MSTDARHPLLVVLVHGIRVSGTMWRPVMEIAGDYHPVAPGPPGTDGDAVAVHHRRGKHAAGVRPAWPDPADT